MILCVGGAGISVCVMCHCVCVSCVTVCVGGLDEKVTETILWELFLQAGLVGMSLCARVCDVSLCVLEGWMRKSQRSYCGSCSCRWGGGGCC